MDFDTGSSDLFLPGSTCGSTCSGHTLYNPSSSSTAKNVGKTFSLAYGDGSTVSGEQYTDVVTLAGLTVRIFISKHILVPFNQSLFMQPDRLRSKPSALPRNTLQGSSLPNSPRMVSSEWDSRVSQTTARVLFSRLSSASRRPPSLILDSSSRQVVLSSPSASSTRICTPVP